MLYTFVESGWIFDAFQNKFILFFPVFNVFNKNSSVFCETNLPVAILNKYRGLIVPKGFIFASIISQYLTQADIVVFDVMRFQS